VNVAELAAYKVRLKVARGELMAAKAAVLPFTEAPAAEASTERVALSAAARGVATIAGVLIRIIDSLPGGSE